MPKIAGVDAIFFLEIKASLTQTKYMQSVYQGLLGPQVHLFSMDLAALGSSSVLASCSSVALSQRARYKERREKELWEMGSCPPSIQSCF